MTKHTEIEQRLAKVEQQIAALEAAVAELQMLVAKPVPAYPPPMWYRPWWGVIPELPYWSGSTCTTITASGTT